MNNTTRYDPIIEDSGCADDPYQYADMAVSRDGEYVEWHEYKTLLDKHIKVCSMINDLYRET